jgi:hypothetical protein
LDINLADEPVSRRPVRQMMLPILHQHSLVVVVYEAPIDHDKEVMEMM